MKQGNLKKNNDNQEFDFESEKNLVGLFALLQKIDKRNNPDLYKKKLTINNKK
jgi:hypothetical protein